MEHLDLRELSECLNLPIERLRYVANQDLVPFRTWFQSEHDAGRPLVFDGVTAMFIGTAAFLLEAGHKRDAVRAFMTAIAEVQPESRNPLHLPMLAHAATGNVNATVQVADGKYVRWKLGRQDTGWIDPGPPPSREEDYRPKVVIAVDFGLIRDLVLARE